MRTSLRRALAALACLAVLAGCDLYYEGADPSPVPADRPADHADAVPDQPPADGPDATSPEDRAAPPDAPDVLDGPLPPEDRPVDIAGDDLFLDQDDAGGDASVDADTTVLDVIADASDAADAPPFDAGADVLFDRTIDDISPDVVDAADDVSADDRPLDASDASDASPDAFPDVGDGEAGPVDAADASTDTPDVSDVPDAGPVATLIIVYRSTNGPYTIPSGGRVGRITYSFGGRMNATCSPMAEPASNYRCVITGVPVATPGAPALYLAVPDACGFGVETRCVGWNEMWTVTWLGVTYSADTRHSVDGGSEPAFALLADRDVCLQRMGYYNQCVRLLL